MKKKIVFTSLLLLILAIGTIYAGGWSSWQYVTSTSGVKLEIQFRETSNGSALRYKVTNSNNEGVDVSLDSQIHFSDGSSHRRRQGSSVRGNGSYTFVEDIFSKNITNVDTTLTVE